MTRQILLTLAIFFFVGCAALPFATPTAAPTADAPATETRIASNIYATQTANAPTPDPRVTETAIAAKIFATQTANAPTPTNTASSQASNITCSFLLPSELPNFASEGPWIYSSVGEWAQDPDPRHPPAWGELLQQVKITSICLNSYTGTNVYDANGNLLPEFQGKPVPAVATNQFTFATPPEAHAVFEKIDLKMGSTILTRVGDESKAFAMYEDKDQRVTYGMVFRKKNTLVLVMLYGPVSSTPSAELVRIAKVMETKIP